MGRNAQIRRARRALVEDRARKRFPGGRPGAREFLERRGRRPKGGL